MDNVASWMCRIACLALLALPAPARAQSPHCALESAVAFRSALSSGIRLRHDLDVLHCIRDSGSRLLDLMQPLEAQHADEFRYFVAQAASDAIDRSGIAGFQALAASWWQMYLSQVSAPYDTRRINFALKKLVQHARYGDFREYWPAVVAGMRAAGVKLDAESGRLVISTLYRCEAWAVLKLPQQETVCTPQCRPLFAELVDTLAPAFNPPPPTVDAARSQLFQDYAAAARRLACAL